NVYPDTLSWQNDFPYSYCQQMTADYFWNPIYSNYPVVGVTYNQAKAFLNWKTLEEQKKLDAKGIKIKVEYDLSNEIEWEIAATSENQNGQLISYGKNFQQLADYSWETDLILSREEMQSESLIRNPLDSIRRKSFDQNFSSDAYIFTAPANLQTLKKKTPFELNGKKYFHDNS